MILGRDDVHEGPDPDEIRNDLCVGRAGLGLIVERVSQALALFSSKRLCVSHIDIV